MKSERLWDRMATNWDTPGVRLGEGDVRLIEKSKPFLHAGDTVLDYGCATGSIALEIANTTREVHGIDLSTRMIEIARRKVAERQVKNVDFRQATIFAESLPEGSFDVILAYNILHLLERPSQAVKRIHQLLKPGGWFISATPCLGQKRVVSTMIAVPVFLFSKIGILPPVHFFSVPGLVASIANENFQIAEEESLSAQPITEYFLVTRKPC